MVTTLAITLFGTIVLWVVLSYLVETEASRGRRIILGTIRQRLDLAVMHCVEGVASVIRYIDRRIIRLSWYYSLHSLLQAALRVVVSLYDYLEKIFHHNRKRARALRAERGVRKKPSGMLHSVALHKETTALSTAQKKKLRTKKLERE